MITDKNKKIVHVNSAFELVTGFKRSEVVGQSPRIFQSGIHPESFYIEMWDEIEGVASGGGKFGIVEKTVRSFRNGSRYGSYR